MQIEKKNVNKILVSFLFAHFVVWTLVPTTANVNLPLDVIESLAWGYGWPLGWDKHPPLSAWFPEFFFQIFGNRDWAYYLLSQLFIIVSFIFVWKFSLDFFKNRTYSLLGLLLLEGIYFYNYTSPEFNVNICQLPFWALSVYYFWKGINKNDFLNWFLFGIFAALGILSKYIFGYLLISLTIFLIYQIVKKELNFKCLISLISFIIIISPHLLWLVENNYITIHYALFRSVGDPLTGFVGPKFLDHLFYPIIFLAKQIGVIFPLLIMIIFLIKKFKIKLNYKDKKFLFLAAVTILPIFLMFFTSLITGARIRTMGMAPFYLFIGVFFIYVFQSQIYFEKIKKFFTTFLMIFILAPTVYYVVSFTQKNERTDYPGKKISEIVQNQWKNNFSNKIEIVVGEGWVNGWYAQNLSYHLKSRPLWKMKLEKYNNKGTVWIRGLNEINNCSGVFYKIKPYNDICMFGDK